MNLCLEVIVTGVTEAREAEAGGADRLELLSSPEHAGLTPPLAVIESVLQAVSIPVRVMLRPRPSMALRQGEIVNMQETAAHLSCLPIDGIVAGYLKDGAVDESGMRHILAAAPGARFTFHRAFDSIAHRQRALDVIKTFPQIDRLLTAAATGEWHSRVTALSNLCATAAPQLRVIFAAGPHAIGQNNSKLAGLLSLGPHLEVHVGRAAREPQALAGTVSRVRVAALKRALTAP